MRIVLLLLAAVILPAGDFSYRQALPGYRYSFPRDYFEHPDFRTEWWYYTGNLRTGSGSRFGFELVFFRQAQRRGPSDNPSAWRIDDLYLAHLALTDIEDRHFFHYKRLNRAGPGIAGASLEKKRIWNGNWSAQWDGDAQILEALADDFRFRLQLKPEKPLIVNGENGVSQKAAGVGNASCYISFPHLAVEGQINGQAVTGTAWMDHEWFTHPLGANQVGWDWFSVQLDNGTDLMLFELRRRDGTLDPYSSGTFVDRQGRARHLSASDFSLKPLETWTSPKTGARYPIRWRIDAPSVGISLDSTAALPNQELPAEGTGPGYWEGAVIYRPAGGSGGGSSGVGYLEMTGYDKPVRLD
ncbi:MAG: lipocalin-like domain-containing protein [Bryobacteraceae bacterium]